MTHRSGCFFSLLYKQVQDPVVMDAQSSFHYLSSLKFKEDMPSWSEIKQLLLPKCNQLYLQGLAHLHDRQCWYVLWTCVGREADDELCGGHLQTMSAYPCTATLPHLNNVMLMQKYIWYWIELNWIECSYTKSSEMGLGAEVLQSYLGVRVSICDGLAIVLWNLYQP